MTATGTDAKSDEVKPATLLHFAGPEALQIYNTFTWTEEGNKKKIDKILEKIEEYCTPRKNITREDTSSTPELSNLVKTLTCTPLTYGKKQVPVS